MSSQNSYKNMAIQIRNGQNSIKPEIYTNSSNLSLNILKVLKEQGYIRGYQFFGKKTKILLKYTAQRPAITKFISLSKKNISLKK
jgi:small subunit ribosomal protein S8